MSETICRSCGTELVRYQCPFCHQLRLEAKAGHMAFDYARYELGYSWTRSDFIATGWEPSIEERTWDHIEAIREDELRSEGDVPHVVITHHEALTMGPAADIAELYEVALSVAYQGATELRVAWFPNRHEAVCSMSPRDRRDFDLAHVNCDSCLT